MPRVREVAPSGESRVLILVPTRRELSCLFPEIGAIGVGEVVTCPDLRDGRGDTLRVAICGLGPTVAGMHARSVLAEAPRPPWVLVGACGTLEPTACPVGSVIAATAAALDGVGAGSGDAFEPATAWAARLPEASELEPLSLAPVPREVPGVRAPVLTACAASRSVEEAAARRDRFPACVAEDMESHAVAIAARSAGGRLAVLRGVSNVAGRRDPGEWRLAESLQAVRAALEAWWGRAA